QDSDVLRAPSLIEKTVFVKGKEDTAKSSKSSPRMIPNLDVSVIVVATCISRDRSERVVSVLVLLWQDS
ncbi:hypothetical protein CH063_10629, partial [Colletotrichum higginsianum]